VSTEEFDLHYARFNADFLILRCFQKVISSKQADFLQEAAQMANEPPENVLNSETLHFSQELHEKLIQALPGMILQFPRLLNEVLLVRSVSCFEVFLTECLKILIELEHHLFENLLDDNKKKEKRAGKKKTKSKQKTVAEKIKALKPLKEKVRFFRNQMGMDFIHQKFSVDELNEMHAERHLIVHNNGIVDKKYLLQTAGHAQYCVGDRVEVSDEYLEKAMTMVVQAAFYVYVELAKKFGTHN
jgi:hypothetical protein